MKYVKLFEQFVKDSFINEKFTFTDTVETAVNESITDHTISKVDSLLESAKAKAIEPKGQMHFMNFLTESKKAEFASLSEEVQNRIVEKMNSTVIMSTIQAENVWESAFKPQRMGLNFIEDMPEKFRGKWENLSEVKQNQIIAESKFHNLTNPYSINNFWATRDLRPSQVELEKLNESKTAAEQTEAAKKEPMVNETFAADLINRVKFNLGR